MDIIKHKKKITRKSLLCLSTAILVVVLFLGLNPKDFNFSNNATWIAKEPGIHFEKFGIAYTNPLIDLVEDDLFDFEEFSFEIALKPESYKEEGFKFILALHSGKDSNQLLTAQWGSWIICMNGDDYAHKRGKKRISMNITSMLSKKGFLTVTTGKGGTKTYFNGQFVHKKGELKLKIPNGGKTRLLLGNSVYGKHSWSGDIYGLAFYAYTLAPGDITRHYNLWFKDQDFSFAKKDNAFGVYFFDDKGKPIVLDRSGRKHHLELPPKMRIFKKAILKPPWKELKFHSNFVQDIIINLVGFIPFGFFLTATLTTLGGIFNKHRVSTTVAICFMVSLFIEIVQAWIPSRSSQTHHNI